MAAAAPARRRRYPPERRNGGRRDGGEVRFPKVLGRGRPWGGGGAALGQAGSAQIRAHETPALCPACPAAAPDRARDSRSRWESQWLTSSRADPRPWPRQPRGRPRSADAGEGDRRGGRSRTAAAGWFARGGTGRARRPVRRACRPRRDTWRITGLNRPRCRLPPARARVDSGGDRRLGDDAPAPDRLDEAVAAHHAAARSTSRPQQVEAWGSTWTAAPRWVRGEGLRYRSRRSRT